MPFQRVLQILVILCGAGLPLAPAQTNWFPFFHRGDPKIETRIFTGGTGLPFRNKRIGIVRFAYRPQPSPPVPHLEVSLRQALEAMGSPEQIRLIDAPWSSGPHDLLSNDERLQRASEAGCRQQFDYMIAGTVDRVIRTSGDGLVAKAEIWVIGSCDGGVHWHSRKRADWQRHYPIEDCLLRLAWSFVEEWSGLPSRSK